MLHRLKSWFTALSTAGKIGVIAAAGFIGVAAAAPSSSSPHTTPTPTPKTANTTNACTSSVTYSTETQTIPYTSTTVEDNSLAKGQTKVTVAGANGEKQLKHQLTKYSPANCKADTNNVTSETVTVQPIAQVTAIGTYVAPTPSPSLDCPNGTYVNSAGNTVCSPYNSETAPSGATAKCRDGTYSFSQSRSGTCSHHGGVAEWL
ncbi:MAG TPA: DUF3761 domain-containing protein [Candidatus Saccharimonadales bacterium]|nr:DUF3761 domain-containing protein [Candidatus Saccharimonadales bacterium]